LRKDAHAFGDVITDPSEVDDIAAASQRGRLFDKQYVVSRFQKPICESGTGDTRSIDGNPHYVFPSTFLSTNRQIVSGPESTALIEIRENQDK
jgi:hypothetical protein